MNIETMDTGKSMSIRLDNNQNEECEEEVLDKHWQKDERVVLIMSLIDISNMFDVARGTSDSVTRISEKLRTLPR